MMKRLQLLHSWAGILAGITYLSFALIAYSQYPGTYTPASRWLSDLGDIRQNPQGAIFYNLGICSTALLLLFYFFGLSQWKLENHKIQNLMVRLTQCFGILGCLALGMSGLFPINLAEQHEFLSISLYILLGTAFGFSVAALRYLPKVPKWVLGLGILTALGDMLSGVFHEVTLLEWITVALFLGYVFVLSLKAMPGHKYRLTETAR